ncbi:MAG: DUF2802 domain-containing protein [Pseudomonadota bacterium]|uniref:DUF2802 domain-containing protein n=1 Tax=Gallaecimonas pentaromativorans TaxID=584787 RepID=UPI00067E7549|nr:DUF2802 domain-containing protein [Gallaecimonas pentaromativorans]MED5526662.1 DUF2802 domain-containing protein [Pseudomonadota bacterium]
MSLVTFLETLLLLLVVAVIVLMYRRQTVLVGRIDDLERQLQDRENLLHEIHSGALGMGKRLLSLAADVERMQGAQDELKSVDPQSKLYSRAAKMVALGADIDELMRECELPRAEAELLFNLHKKP